MAVCSAWEMTADPQSQSSEPLQRGRLAERERKGKSEGEGVTRAHPSRYKRETQFLLRTSRIAE